MSRTRKWWWALAAGASVLLLATYAVTTQIIANEREAAYAKAVDSNRHMALSDEIRVRSLLASLDKVLLVMRQDFLDHPRLTHEDLLLRLQQLQVERELNPRVSIFDARGETIASSANDARNQKLEVNVADRDYFRQQQAAQQDLLGFAPAVRSRVTGLWVIPLTRRLLHQDGSFAGVISLLVDPKLFTAAFEQTSQAGNATRAIIGLDGYTRVRVNGLRVDYGGDSRRSHLFEEIRRSPTGAYIAAAASDGVVRAVSYRTIAPYSVIVVAGTDVQDIEASYAGMAQRATVAAYLIACLTVLLAAALMVVVHRREKYRLQLHADAERYKALFEKTPVMHLVCEIQGDVPVMVTCNERLSMALSYLPGELAGKPLSGILDPLWPGTRDLLGLHLEVGQGASFVGKHPLRKRDGSRLTAMVEMTPELVDGAPCGMVRASFIDISESERVTARLKESQLSFAHLIEQLPQLISCLDPSGAVIWVNGKTLDYLGQPADGQARSFDWLMASVHEEDRRHALQFVARALLGATPADACEFRYRRFDGVYLWHSIQVNLMLDGEGAVASYLQTSTDIHDRKMAEERARVLQNMESIGQLTGGLAHDFNNLLAIVVGNLDLLKRSTRAGEDMQRLDIARAAAERGVAVVKSLLTLASRRALQPAIVSLQTLVERAMPLLRHALGPRVQLRVQPPAFDVHVEVDEAGLESALLNLVVNARDAMPQGGALHIALGASEGMALLSVRDTGTGMAAAVLKRATEPFFTTKPQTRGTGLGLAMVAGFVKQSGGTMKIQSAEGTGTTVELRLPLVFAPEDTTPPSPVPTLQPARALTVLIVEDEPEIAALIRVWGAEEGHHMVLAPNAGEALDLLAQTRFDILLTDITMPGPLDGIELARQAAQRYPSLGILLMSGYSRDAVDARDPYPWDMLVKPFLKQALLQGMANALADLGVSSE